MNKLKSRMIEVYALYESISTQEDFINYLQWPANKPFYFGWGSVDASGNREGEGQYQANEEEEEDEGEKEDNEEGVMKKRLVKVMIRSTL